MKRTYFLISVLFLFASCSKKGVTPLDTNTIKINGTDYPTVTIGNQVWTTVNYNGPGGYHSDEHNQYGNYYTQNQALALSLPTGWHVPSMSDYSTLLSNFTSVKDGNGYFVLEGNSATTMIAAVGWPYMGTNKSGFNAQPAGLFQVIGQTYTFQTDGAAGYFMTADHSSVNGRLGLLISFPNGAVVGASAYSTSIVVAYSLRFVKDR